MEIVLFIPMALGRQLSGDKLLAARRSHWDGGHARANISAVLGARGALRLCSSRANNLDRSTLRQPQASDRFLRQTHREI